MKFLEYMKGAEETTQNLAMIIPGVLLLACVGGFFNDCSGGQQDAVVAGLLDAGHEPVAVDCLITHSLDSCIRMREAAQ